MKTLMKMKTMATTFLVLGLLACILNITSADNSSVSTTNEATQPGGTSSNSTSSKAPSTNDLAKAADPAFEASELETPFRWLADALYYIGYYAIYEPISLVADAAIAPITLPIDAVSIPINFLFGDYLEPVYSFIGNQYQMIKNIIWWIVLESISYGSGATADTISEAMRIALDGILQFFTDIGLPLANSAEKLSQLTDQIATTRRKRSVMSAFGGLGDGLVQLIQFPFMLMGGIFSIITYPLRMIYGLI
ncbi:uncharacterized protein LOC117172043 isoform X2 [Belonocnema kinseyi]|uniref:uncharacterized protein LOC117172043 isoform X2 n=1 Tax=Belonocnema kinseyi TaxID=2817044 RepID=UPI00143CE582|nr:uncharacterized protein LOC117172043 isoform X2 [Belonocnema kinseyi]